MLSQLRIKDFILIDEQEISLEAGLNVLTGESGAGKSIILQAIQVLLGAKPKGEVVRPGAEEALVEGLFILENLPQSLREELPDLLHAEDLLISRSINLSGKSKVYINGRLSSLSMLESLKSRLINICSQNQQVRLLDPKYHLETLDGFLNKPAELESYRKLFLEFSQASRDLAELEKKVQNQSAEESQIQVLCEELSGIELRKGRRQQLEDELKKIQGSERLAEICCRLAVELSVDSQFMASIKSLQLAASELAKYDQQFGSEISSNLSAVRASVSDCEFSIQRYQGKIDLNQEKLESLRQELGELARLMRKYKKDEEQLAEMLAQASAQLGSADDLRLLTELRKKVSGMESDVRSRAMKISTQRNKAARDLSRQVVAGLADVNLKDSCFEVIFEQKPLSADGSDKVEFKLSTNKGMGLKALRDVASGGELSRILLVLKQVLREVSGVNVLVFDEVDSGISGAVARAVGEKLKDLSGFSQVLCITHLAQVASLASHHLVVNKTQDRLATTVVKTVFGENRIEEIARMISGHSVTKASKESAKELLGL